MNKSESAFPFVIPTDKGNIICSGMALRDYFAAMALQGALAHNSDVNDHLRFADWCYEMADYMLEARE